MAGIDRRSFIGLSAAAAAGCMARSAGPVPEFDDSLSVLVADAHVCGGSERAGEFTPRRLARFVDEVLSMRPLPKRVVHLGDLAYLYGSACDYAAARPHLKRLEDAGVELVFCMGNHDRRSEFDKAFPGHLAKSPVPGKCVSVASLGSADLVILDPDREITVDANTFASKGRNTPFHGKNYFGAVCATMVGGRMIYEEE